MFNNYNIPNVCLVEEQAMYFSIVGENEAYDFLLDVSIEVESGALCEEAYNCRNLYYCFMV